MTKKKKKSWSCIIMTKAKKKNGDSCSIFEPISYSLSTHQPSKVARIWPIMTVRMDLQCVKKTRALWTRPLYTHTGPLLVINERLCLSPLMTVNGTVGCSPSTLQCEDNTGEPWQFYVTSHPRWIHLQIVEQWKQADDTHRGFLCVSFLAENLMFLWILIQLTGQQFENEL